MPKKEVLYPKVSIIIPCKNEEKYIEKNVDSILAQDYAGEIEVLVVDGMSTDRTREIVGGYDNPAVRLIDNPAQFTPHALNIGVDAAQGDVFIILGGHAFLNADFVSRNITALQNDSKVGCAGGLIHNIYENKTGEIISQAMSSVFGVGNATFRTGGKKGYVDTVAFGAYWKKIHYEIGGFDEDLVRNQDDEYNFKVKKAGYEIFFDPEIKSNYYVRGSFSKLYRQYYQYGYWKVFVNRKHKTITTVRQLFPLFMVLGLGLGILISLFFPLFMVPVLAGLILYATMAIYFGTKAADDKDEAISVAQVFPILHFSYGLGYLVGVWKFLILRKNPSSRSKELTR